MRDDLDDPACLDARLCLGEGTGKGETTPDLGVEGREPGGRGARRFFLVRVWPLIDREGETLP